MDFLKNKKALIVGLASNRSIAYGIAKSLNNFGVQLAFTYQNEKLKERVENMAKEFSPNSSICIQCDVSDDNQINNVFSVLKQSWGTFDILIHSVAYAPADQLNGDFLETLTEKDLE